MSQNNSKIEKTNCIIFSQAKEAAHHLSVLDLQCLDFFLKNPHRLLETRLVFFLCSVRLLLLLFQISEHGLSTLQKVQDMEHKKTST